MKKLAQAFLVAALGGSFFASALDATNAQVELGKVGTSLAVERAGLPGGYFAAPGAKKGPSAKGESTTGAWQYFSIPLKIEGLAKGGDKPHYVPALTVTIYGVFKAVSKDDSPLLLSTKMTYVDIPLDKSGKGEFEVAAFISPADAQKMVGEKDKPDLAGRLQAFAVEVEFNGNNCVKRGTEPFAIFDGSLKRSLGDSGRWWKKNGKTNGARLQCISETPYAPFYGSRYPATRPIYGPAAVESAGPAPTARSTGDDE